MAPESRIRPAGDGPDSNKLNGDKGNRTALNLPEASERVAELLNAVDTEDARRQIRLMVYGPQARMRARQAAEHLIELSDTADLAVILDEMRTDYSAVAAAINQAVS